MATPSVVAAALIAAWAGLLYPLDDFDDGRLANDFAGASGPWADSPSRAEWRFIEPGADGTGACLRLDFRANPNSAGCGWWWKLAPQWRDAATTRDLRPFTALILKLRSDGRPKGARLFVELNAGGRFRVPIPWPGPGWQRVEIPLTRFGPAADPWRAETLALVIRAEKAPAEGTLFVDDVYLEAREQAPATDAQLLGWLQRRAVQYFLDLQHPQTGLFADNCLNPAQCSIAACGFGLLALCIAAERGFLPRAEAAQRALRCLRTLRRAQAEISAEHPEAAGFLYHFLDCSTARRFGRSEVSTIDTALAAAGALLAAEYFAGDAPAERQIRQAAAELFRAINWAAFYDSDRRQFKMAWSPERGFFGHWGWYTDEALLICLLAIASPSHPAPVDCLWGFRRERKSYGLYSLVCSWTGSLFTYFFCALLVDLRGLCDRHPSAPVNWWENARAAVRAQLLFCRRNAGEYQTYRIAWGLSAGPGPRGYAGDYGGAPCGRPNGPKHDGTVHPYALAMALPALAGEAQRRGSAPAEQLGPAAPQPRSAATRRPRNGSADSKGASRAAFGGRQFASGGQGRLMALQARQAPNGPTAAAPAFVWAGHAELMPPHISALLLRRANLASARAAWTIWAAGLPLAGAAAADAGRGPGAEARGGADEAARAVQQVRVRYASSGPRAALDALWNLFRLEKARAIYGLRDGINLGRSPRPEDDWFSHNFCAIDLGPLLVGIENYRTGLIWKLSRRNRWLSEAVKRAFRPAQ